MAAKTHHWVRIFEVNETKRHPKGYTIYQVKSTVFPRSSPEALTSVCVWRRYSEVRHLHRAISELHAKLKLQGQVPPFPKATVLNRFEADVVESRRQAALNLLKFIGQHNVLFTSEAFNNFIQNDEETIKGHKTKGKRKNSKEKLKEDHLASTLGIQESTSLYAQLSDAEEDLSICSSIDSPPPSLQPPFNSSEPPLPNLEPPPNSRESHLPDVDCSLPALKSPPASPVLPTSRKGVYVLYSDPKTLNTLNGSPDKRKMPGTTQSTIYDTQEAYQTFTSNNNKETLKRGDGEILDPSHDLDGEYEVESNSVFEFSPSDDGLIKGDREEEIKAERHTSVSSMSSASSQPFYVYENPVHESPKQQDAPYTNETVPIDVPFQRRPLPPIDVNRRSSIGSRKSSVPLTPLTPLTQTVTPLVPSTRGLPSPQEVANAQYIFVAAQQISEAQQHEQQRQYKQALNMYREGVNTLLQGVQAGPVEEQARKRENSSSGAKIDLASGEDDIMKLENGAEWSGESEGGRREAVKRKTAQYLQRAEQLVARLTRKDRKQSQNEDSLTAGISEAEGGLKCRSSDLSRYHVVGVAGSVIIATDTKTADTVAIKVVVKSGSGSGERTIVPVGVPYMVPLLRYHETYSAIFLILKFISGGKLWSHIGRYVNQSGSVGGFHIPNQIFDSSTSTYCGRRLIIDTPEADTPSCDTSSRAPPIPTGTTPTYLSARVPCLTPDMSSSCLSHKSTSGLSYPSCINSDVSSSVLSPTPVTTTAAQTYLSSKNYHHLTVPSCESSSAGGSSGGSEASSSCLPDGYLPIFSEYAGHNALPSSPSLVAIPRSSDSRADSVPKSRSAGVLCVSGVEEDLKVADIKNGDDGDRASVGSDTLSGVSEDFSCSVPGPSIPVDPPALPEVRVTNNTPVTGTSVNVGIDCFDKAAGHQIKHEQDNTKIKATIGKTVEDSNKIKETSYLKPEHDREDEDLSMATDTSFASVTLPSFSWTGRDEDEVASIGIDELIRNSRLLLKNVDVTLRQSKSQCLTPQPSSAAQPDNGSDDSTSLDHSDLPFDHPDLPLDRPHPHPEPADFHPDHDLPLDLPDLPFDLPDVPSHTPGQPDVPSSRSEIHVDHLHNCPNNNSNTKKNNNQLGQGFNSGNKSSCVETNGNHSYCKGGSYLSTGNNTVIDGNIKSSDKNKVNGKENLISRKDNLLSRESDNRNTLPRQSKLRQKYEDLSENTTLPTRKQKKMESREQKMKSITDAHPSLSKSEIALGNNSDLPPLISNGSGMTVQADLRNCNASTTTTNKNEQCDKISAIVEGSTSSHKSKQCNNLTTQQKSTNNVSLTSHESKNNQSVYLERSTSSLAALLDQHAASRGIKDGAARLPEGLVRVWLSQVISALTVLHHMGIIWSDLRPDNLLLDEGGSVVLTYESQWSCVVRGWSESRGEWSTSEGYLAPELVSPLLHPTPACDWWTVGALLYHMLTGQSVASAHPSGFTSHTELFLPSHLSPEAASLLSQLLCAHPTERLGGGAAGAQEVKDHPFFVGVQWPSV